MLNARFAENHTRFITGLFKIKRLALLAWKKQEKTGSGVKLNDIRINRLCLSCDIYDVDVGGGVDENL